MDAIQFIQRLHQHRVWVNRNLLEADTLLSDEQWWSPFPICQGSIWTLLVHLYAAEFVWLIDTGIGLLDVQDPVGRLGQQLIDMAGFQFNEYNTAARRIENPGSSADDARHIVMTHCDPDHAGGLADFPYAQIHVAREELTHALSGHWRYIPRQFQHNPRRKTYEPVQRRWFGLEVRPVSPGFSSEVLLIPLFGHALEHCGVAALTGEGWQLHVGDAYYLRAELTDENHPVSALAAQRAANDPWRRSTLNKLRRLVADHGNEIQIISYHDIKVLVKDAW